MLNASAGGHDIANTLGWGNIALRDREITQGGTKLDTSRGIIAGKPAALFARVTAKNGYDPLESAAIYAYHANVDWGLLADDEGVEVFNSHRFVERDWFKLPKIAWQDVGANAQLWDALSPAGLIDGAIEVIAAKYDAPTSILKPIDDRLVERLDKWREQALRYSRDSQRVDEKLQTLYAQLFVLRAVEDRKLSPGVPPVNSVLVGSDGIDTAAWTNLQNQAKSAIGSDLFDQDMVTGMPAHVIAGVIRDLYSPGFNPGVSFRYDFSWIEADVLGAAYEKYLSTVLHPLPVSSQTELFYEPQNEVERITVRKSSGTYYTPKFIHDYIAKRAVDEFYGVAAPDALPSVVDFACGSGSFLVAAADEVLSRLKLVDPNKAWAKELIQGGHIVGIDIDPKTISIARLRLWHRLIEEPDALPLPDLSRFIVAANGLAAETWGDLSKPYDIVLGNPPFLSNTSLPNREDLAGKFASAKGRFDFSYLFVEQAINVLTDIGIFGLVVPNRLLINPNAEPIRQILIDSASLCSVVDFKSTRPFPDASAYVACMIGKKRPKGVAIPDTVRVIEVEALEHEYLAALLLKCDADTNDISVPLKAFTAKHPTSGQPWLLMSSTARRSRALIENAAIRLDDLASINQGIRTGSNDLFIFDIQGRDDKVAFVTNGIGDTAIIEVELLEPVMYGSELARYSRTRPTQEILYPYKNRVAISEAILRDRFPHAWEYLQRYHDLLSSRSSVTGSTRWYELIRARDERWLRLPKLLIRDLAQRTSFALDDTGHTFIVGGTSVVPASIDMTLPLLAYLNSSPISSFIGRSTPQFRGNFQKYEPQHLQGVPVLTSLVEDPNFSGKLAELAESIISAYEVHDVSHALALEDEVDQVVRASALDFGIVLED